MSKVFVVMAESGEYSDREVHVLAVYDDEQIARRHAELAEAWHREYGPKDWLSRVKRDVPNPYDKLGPGSDPRCYGAWVEESSMAMLPAWVTPKETAA